MAMWPILPRGHGAFDTSTIGSSTASTPMQRRIRNVSGGANGRPNLAAMNPVLHRSTKKIGTGDSQAGAVRGVVTDGVDMVLVDRSRAGTTSLACVLDKCFRI